MNKIYAIDAILNLHLYYILEIMNGDNILAMPEKEKRISSEAFPKFLYPFL